MIHKRGEMITTLPFADQKLCKRVLCQTVKTHESGTSSGSELFATLIYFEIITLQVI